MDIYFLFSLDDEDSDVSDLFRWTTLVWRQDNCLLVLQIVRDKNGYWNYSIMRKLRLFFVIDGSGTTGRMEWADLTSCYQIGRICDCHPILFDCRRHMVMHGVRCLGGDGTEGRVRTTGNRTVGKERSSDRWGAKSLLWCTGRKIKVRDCGTGKQQLLL
jgi:hypothetical protein